ncbi:Mu-like prophage FluMu protein gp35 [Photorhabdus australis subsp. thailandensis]|uniref:Mu-like prophage FluMu protein gp35 n=1 Tax=Photorhabdus australis subsp. thailandensis TaxID=2805096 RepID=A0A1C0TZ56_9GAMM|nr:HI1506-related protein [Photorhabdus australis]OCQ50957.1 Mu-like prophage FluMu protein gp35 [Photorhabdus australis subsp. thailandensis]
MSEKISMAENAETRDVCVVNTAHDGYRRAGFVLVRGENTLPTVDVNQCQALEADPRLSVTVITTDTDNDEPGRLAHQDNLSPLTGPEQPGRDERLLNAVMCAEQEADPLVFFTKSGTPRIEKWREIVGDDITVDEITAALARVNK